MTILLEPQPGADLATRPVAGPLFRAMSGTMLISVAGLSGYASIRRVVISLPLVPQLLEEGGRYFLPGERDPADPTPEPVRRHRTRERERLWRARAARDRIETRVITRAVELLRRREREPRPPSAWNP